MIFQFVRAPFLQRPHPSWQLSQCTWKVRFCDWKPFQVPIFWNASDRDFAFDNPARMAERRVSKKSLACKSNFASRNIRLAIAKSQDLSPMRFLNAVVGQLSHRQEEGLANGGLRSRLSGPAGGVWRVGGGGWNGPVAPPKSLEVTVLVHNCPQLPLVVVSFHKKVPKEKRPTGPKNVHNYRERMCTKPPLIAPIYTSSI